MNKHYQTFAIGSKVSELPVIRLKNPFSLYCSRVDFAEIHLFSPEAVERMTENNLVFKRGQEDLLVAVYNLLYLSGEDALIRSIVNDTDIEIDGNDLIETE